MCGIWALVNQQRSNKKHATQSGGDNKEDESEPMLYECFQNMTHRGPDYSSFQHYDAIDLDNQPINVYAGFHRLSIVNSSVHGNQPFVLEDDKRTIVFLCNGEIYNWKEICARYQCTTDNDCMVVPMLYMKYPTEFLTYVSQLKGEFAFVLFEYTMHKKGMQLTTVIAARDQVGVRPLYYHPHPTLFFTSEIKGAPKHISVCEFPPGTMMVFHENQCTAHNFASIYNVTPIVKEEEMYLRRINVTVRAAVQRRLAASKPFAYLLSGGIDSSLVAAIGADEARNSHIPIRTFCCSIKEGTYKIGNHAPFTTGPGTDLLYAREVAKHICSDHTEVFFTPHEGLNAIKDVIRTIESWDTTTVRASVGQYMVCKWIGENTDCKVVMVGEGPDEVCSSYLFNWYCPNGKALEQSAKEYVRNIHYYDVKRADRCISRWGLEGRVPLLDPDFIKAYWEIPGELRLPKTKGIEKWWLREAFSPSIDSRGGPFLSSLLPESVRMRKKEAFSDGVSNSKSWYEMIQDFVEDKVTDAQLNTAAEPFPYCTPTTKEAYYYRQIFERLFPGPGPGRADVIPGFWQPKWTANGQEVQGYVDPSARTLEVYQA
jgi:asparagine synthase (glutamine-hydrolysing)